jgi:hypothetical protein
VFFIQWVLVLFVHSSTAIDINLVGTFETLLNVSTLLATLLGATVRVRGFLL